MKMKMHWNVSSMYRSQTKWCDGKLSPAIIPIRLGDKEDLKFLTKIFPFHLREYIFEHLEKIIFLGYNGDVKMDFDINEYLAKLYCDKRIQRSKYERPDPKVVIWWGERFKELEEKFSLPNYKKKRILRDHYSIDCLDDFEEIGIDMRDESYEDVGKSSSLVVDRSKISALEKLGVDDEEKIIQKEKEDPFINLMGKSLKETQIWREKEKVTLDSLSLMEKADNMTENIADGFDKYLKSIGGQKQINLDKDIINELFTLHANLPAETSLCANGRELMAIPPAIAKLAKKPKLAERAIIKEEIKTDLNVKGKNTTPIAFGKSLPLRLRVNPRQTDIENRWKGCYVYHDELVSMTKVFDEITELMSVRCFCKWLLDHPEIPRVKFLQDKGFYDKKFLSRKVISAYQILGDDDHFENLATQSFEEYNKLVGRQTIKNLTKI